MLTSNISFKAFKEKGKNLNLNKKLFFLLRENNEVLKSLSKKYRDSFDSKKFKKYKKNFNFRVIGMGGSILGTKTIYEFLGEKIKKKFSFIDNLQPKKKLIKKKILLI